VQKGEEEKSDMDAEKHVYWDEPEMRLMGYLVASEAIHGLHFWVW
jgi:hypothetical protein